MTTIRLLVATAILSAAWAAPAPGSPQLDGTPPELGWVGLYSNELIGWLENENKLDTLCAASSGDAERWEQCRSEKLQPRRYAVSLREQPSASARPAGTLLLLAVPGRGLRSFYAAAGAGAPREFEPDLYLQDWGYGPWFHQTYLDRRGDWFLLPEDPFPRGTWFNARDLGDDPHVRTPEGIVRSPRGTIVILAVEPDAIRARPEQPADMWCESGDPPPLEPWTEIRILRRDLYSPTGHLLISPAYMKGC